MYFNICLILPLQLFLRKYKLIILKLTEQNSLILLYINVWLGTR